MFFHLASILKLTFVIHSITATTTLDCALGLTPQPQCPVNGGWSLWSLWGSCEGECGSVGRQLRFRNCSNPPPSPRGEPCQGDQLEVKQCVITGCSFERYQKQVAGDPLREAQLMTLKQIAGSQHALLAKCLSSSCHFSAVQQALDKDANRFWTALQCIKKNTGCPVVGGWGQWSVWSRCSAQCGSGHQVRCRVCCDPPPSSPDRDCRGDSCEYQECSATDCGSGNSLLPDGVWGEWSEWSKCSSPCNLGISRRFRVCQKENINRQRKNLIYYDTHYYDEDGIDENDYYELEGGWSSSPVKRSNVNLNSSDYNYQSDENNCRVTVATTGVSQTTNDLEDVEQEDCSLSSGEQNQDNTLEDDEEYEEDEEGDLQIIVDKFQETSLSNPSEIISSTIALSTSQDERSTIENEPENVDNPDDDDSDKCTGGLYENTITGDKTAKVLLTTLFSSTNILDTSSLKDDNCTNPYQSGKPYDATVAFTESDLPKSQKSETNRTHSSKVKVTENLSYSIGSTADLTSPCISLRDGYMKTSLSSENVKSTKASARNSAVSVRMPTKITKSSSVKNDESTYLSTCTYFFTASPSSSTNKQPIKSPKPKTTFKTQSKLVSSMTFHPTPIDNVYTDSTEPDDSYKSSLENEDDTDVSSLTLFPSLDPVVSSQVSKKLIQNNNYFSQTRSVTSSHLKDTTVPAPSRSRTSPVLNDFTQKPSNSITSSTSFVSTLKLNHSTLPNSSDDYEIFGTENPTKLVNLKNCDLKSVLDFPSYNESYKGAICKGQFEEIKSCNTGPCSVVGRGRGLVILGRVVSLLHRVWRGHTGLNTSLLFPRTFCPGCYLLWRVYFDSLLLPSTMPRFRFFSGQDQKLLLLRHSSHGDLVKLSLYGGCVLFSIKEHKCRADILSNQVLLVGDWHSILVTVVGSVATLRVDDAVLQSSLLSCRPVMPDYDAHMTLGGAQGLSGEVELISVNFHKYNLLKTQTASSPKNRRQAEQTRQKQAIASDELLTQSLSHLLMAPCYLNHSDWQIQLAIKPELSDGLVLFLHGSGKNEYLFVSLEQSRVRLRVCQSSATGECEVAGPVAARAWLLLDLTRPPEGPVGLSVNGGPRCIISLATGDDAEEPPVHCNGDILLGEMPLSVKTALLSDGNHSIPLHSPQGLLGILAVDNHSLDLSRLPFRVPPDRNRIYPSNQYKFSSLVSSSTVYYEERLVLRDEPISMVCVYDLSGEKSQGNLYSRSIDLDSTDYSATWIKLDLPVDIAFGNGSDVKFEIFDNGKSTSLNISAYKSVSEVEGFYSCWLSHPLPMTPGLNIVTYSITITAGQEGRGVLGFLINAHLVLSILLVIVFIVWLIVEAVLDFKKGCGFYRREQLNNEQFHNRVHHMMFSDKGLELLGGLDSANRSYGQFLEAAAALDLRPEQEETDVVEETHPEPEHGSKDYDTVANSHPENRRSKPVQNVPVAFVEFQPDSAFLNKRRKNSKEKRKTVFSSMDESTRPENENETNLNVGSRLRAGDNFIDVWEGWQPKDIRKQTPQVIGLIQNTPAFHSIRNELKFKPEKFKELKKYQECNQST